VRSTPDGVAHIKLSRKDFLKSLAALTLVTVVPVSALANEKDSKETLPDALKFLEDIDTTFLDNEGKLFVRTVQGEIRDGGYLRTSVETALYMVGQYIAMQFIPSHFGDAPAQVEWKPTDQIKAVTFGPLEEVYLRYIPSTIVDTQLSKGLHMLDVGVPIAALFALLHIVQKDSEGKPRSLIIFHGRNSHSACTCGI
jgi:hypothetical protein